NILIRVTPEPFWDTKEFSFPVHNGQLPYGLRVGHNVLVSDAHFQHEYLNDPQYRRPGNPTLSSNNLRSMKGSSSTSPCSSSSKISPVLTGSVDQTGEYADDQFYSSPITDWDSQNGDSNPLMKETRESMFRSLPIVVPIWQQATWVATSHPRYTAIVADLGLCLDLSRENVDTISLVGNPYYIAPECLNRVAPYSFAADLFAVGLLICELITLLVNDGANVPRTKVSFCKLTCYSFHWIAGL
ncbi:Dual specificity testis-specific protein kinase, partial [Fasciolopsis buskii]